ncbi:hypothetical protein P5673_032958 [Acropora cervicornis]|uniref:Uncharacterized protein n=1 Tax=Acropora cervicornis TaxID=6130 RepID=A0AAD9PQK2_ACRCE|nr:hypothetical protein P5673_032958 [Acropora cervicornis]
MQDKAIAMHRLRRTFALGLLIARQNIRETAIVTRTAIKEIEHPTIEIISRALRFTRHKLAASGFPQRRTSRSPKDTCCFQGGTGWNTNLKGSDARTNTLYRLAQPRKVVSCSTGMKIQDKYIM